VLWLSETWRWLRSWRQRSQLERRLDEEIGFHIDAQTRKNRRAGMSRVEARRRALIRFGGAEGVKERTRDQIRSVVLDDLVRDLRHSLRSLRRAPGFTLLVSLTLALGIGATTAVFSVVHGVLIKPLSYPDSDALMAVWHTAPSLNLPQMQISPTQYCTYREENRVFDEFGVWTVGPATVSGLEAPEEVRTLMVSGGTLEALGMSPIVGRWFSEEEHAARAPATVMLTDGYWQRRYGGDRSVIGDVLMVDSRPRTIIGVMPGDFRFPDQIRDLILPFQFARDQLFLGGFFLRGVARLNPGVTVAQANADIARMVPMWLSAWPVPPGADPQMFESAQIAPALQSLKDDVVGDLGGALWVLLVACANAANLLLVRTEGRRPELAIRVALGAGWYRVARQLILESVVLAALGGGLGLGLAMVAVRVLVAVAPASLPRLDEIGMDPVVLAFTVAVSLFSAVASGLIPVSRHASGRIGMVLRASDRTASESRERHRVKNTLVVAQVALALVLLVGSGLMVRTFQALRAVEPGFVDPDRIQLVRITFPVTEFEDDERIFNVQRAIVDGLSAVAGVSTASFIRTAPLGGFNATDPILVEDHPDAAEGALIARRSKFVAPGFFQTIGTSLLAGRDYCYFLFESFHDHASRRLRFRARLRRRRIRHFTNQT